MASDPNTEERLKAALADRYRIESEIGSGGMATVYVAEDLKHGRKVAVKVLKPELAQSLGAERFLREIRTAANLTHPHILPVHDSGEADGLLFYVMPFVEGESLQERIGRERKLPIEDAVQIARDVADALAFAHERGVIHRDVKPANILLEAGHAVLADFGIACAVAEADEERITQTGLSLGTPTYMSPEQAAGEGDLDGRSDQYALACVLYEMLAGEPPYAGASPQAVIAKMLSEPTPRVSTLRETVPDTVEHAITKALAKAPVDRFPTAKAFAGAMTATTVLPRAGARDRAGRRWAGALFGVALAAVSVWGAASVLGGQSMVWVAVLPLVDLTNDPEQEHLVSGVHDALIKELGSLGLSVIEKRTMVRYPDTGQGMGEIARDLGVDGVIDGTVLRVGNRLEIAARLYDRDDRELWENTFEGTMPNIVSLYRGFAQQIASEIRLRLRPEDEARLAEAAPVNPAVYEAYFLGMAALNKARSREDLYEAIDYFHQAVDQNPASALALAGLALGYATLGHDIAPPDDAWPMAGEAAERAIQLDPTLAEGWAALADYKAYSLRDWEGAEEAFLRANQLNPSLALNHFHYAWFLVLFGRVEEAFDEHRLAARLDPLTPVHTVYIPGLYWFVEDYQRAVEESRLGVERFPESHRAYFTLGESAALAGRYDEAIPAFQEMATLFPDRIGHLGHTYARAGRTEDALRIVEQLEARPTTPGESQSLALIYAALGDREGALRWLEHQPPHAWLAWVMTSWYRDFDSFRDDPRYQDLLRRMNLRFGPEDRWPVALPLFPTTPQEGEGPKIP